MRYGEIVVINEGKDEGKIGRLMGSTADEKLHDIRFYELYNGVPGRTHSSVYTSSALFPTSSFSTYVNPNVLIRPIAVGDSIVIREKLFVYFDRQSLPYQGKALTVVGMEDKWGKIVYNTHSAFWILENIDISKTNKLLMEKYHLSARKEPKLPVL